MHTYLELQIAKQYLNGVDELQLNT